LCTKSDFKHDSSSGSINQGLVNTAELSSPFVGLDFKIRKSDGALGTYYGSYKYSSTVKATSGEWAIGYIKFTTGAGGKIEVKLDDGDYDIVHAGAVTTNLLTNDGSVQIGRYAGGSDFFSGGIDYVKITTPSETYRYDFGEGADNIIYDRNPINPINGTIVDANLDDFWDVDEKATPNNLINGFDLWQNDTDGSYIRIPVDTDGNSILTNGDTLTGYTWISKCFAGKWHNRAESKLLNYESPELYRAEQDAGLSEDYYFTGTTPRKIPYADITYNKESKNFFFANAEALKKRNIIVYSTDQEDNLSKIYKSIKADYIIINGEKIYIGTIPIIKGV